MDDADGVGGLERVEHLAHERHGVARREAPEALDPRAERLALEVLHHHVAGAVGHDAEVEDLADVLGADATGGLRLALETRHRLGLARHVAVEHLDGDAPVDAEVLAFVNGAHPAAAEQPREAVFAVDDLADVPAHGLDASVAGGPEWRTPSGLREPPRTPGRSLPRREARDGECAARSAEPNPSQTAVS